MLQALYQTIMNFLIDIPAIGNLVEQISSGETNLLGGVVSLISGLFGKKEEE